MIDCKDCRFYHIYRKGKYLAEDTERCMFHRYDLYYASKSLQFLRSIKGTCGPSAEFFQKRSQ